MKYTDKQIQAMRDQLYEVQSNKINDPKRLQNYLKEIQHPAPKLSSDLMESTINLVQKNQGV